MLDVESQELELSKNSKTLKKWVDSEQPQSKSVHFGW